MNNFNKKVAVITGGASGVGRSIAFTLGRLGAKVVIADVDKNALEQTCDALNAENIEAIAQYCDVSSAQSCEDLSQKALSTYGALHLVFANAGVSAAEAGNMWEYSERDWQWTFNVNVWGVVNTINAFMPKLLEQNIEAHFAITGSRNGSLLIFPNIPIYTASKAAIHSITENLYHQIAAMDTPVKVHCLIPGPHVVETGLLNSERVRPAELKIENPRAQTAAKSIDEMKRNAAAKGVDLQTTHPDEVAAMVVKAIKEDQFWILETTPDTEERIINRAQDIIDQRPPRSLIVK
jgi:NAD(P)-dependent dehydrogenase (short-subunit alcohol dehydrogenase family)